MKRQMIVFFLILTATQQIWADLNQYNLQQFKNHLPIGSHSGQVLYLSFYSEFMGGNTSGIVLVRTDTLAHDVSFSVGFDEKTGPYVANPDDFSPTIAPGIIQILYEGFCSPQIGSAKTDTLVFSYSADCNRYSEPNTTTDKWLWRNNRFEKISTQTRYPFQEQLKLFRQLLKAGKIARAIQSVPECMPTGHADPCYDLYQELVDAAYPMILKSYRNADPFAAIAMIRLLLNSKLVCSCNNEGEQRFIIQKKYLSRDANGNPYNELPTLTMGVNGKNTGILNDFAFIIGDLFPQQAAGLLEQIIKHQPKRTVAYLNLADIYYDALEKSIYLANGTHPHIKALYTKYMQLMKQQGKQNRIPMRVQQRTIH
jgi:hypothetical protein